MTIRSKTKRRLIILVSGVLVLVALFAGLAVVRFAQVRAEYRAMREEGLAANRRGDHAVCVEQLDKYVARYPHDAQALFALAESRRQVEAIEGRHLMAALRRYQQVVSLQPENREARRQVVLLYNQLGNNSETIDSASEYLRTNPEDAAVLVARAQALLRLAIGEKRASAAEKSNLQRAADDIEAAIRLEPLNVEGQLLKLQILRETNRTDEILPYARALLERHRDDPRSQIVMAFACQIVGELSEETWKELAQFATASYSAAQWKPLSDEVQDFAQRLGENIGSEDPRFQLACARYRATMAGRFFARQASRGDVSDPAAVLVLVRCLEQLRLAGAAAAVLEQAIQHRPEPSLRRMLMRRLFELHRFEALARCAEGLSLSPSSAMDVDLIGMKAVALAQLGRRPEAESLATALAGVSGDRVAQAWAVILRQAVLAEGDTPSLVEAVRSALDVRRRNPYLWYYLGEAFFRLDERDHAIEAFKQVTALSPVWAQPWLYLSQLYRATGQPDQAAAAARAAVELALADAIGQVEPPLTREPQALLVYVQSLALTGRKPAVEKAIRSAIGFQPALPLPVLLQLASISRDLKLGLEESCLALAEKQYGAAPELVLARAVQLRDAGKPADGARLIEQALAAPAAKDPHWRLVWARYLDLIGDARAISVWRELGKDPAAAKDLSIQRACLVALTARADPSDRDLLLQVTDRIRALTGEQSLSWRVARAGILAVRDAPEADLKEASRLLQEVLARDPDHLTSRLLQAEISERLGNTQAAMEQYNMILKSRPEAATVRLALARLYQSQDDLIRAREQLDRIRPQDLPLQSQFSYARLLAQTGETARAAGILSGGLTDPTTRPADALLLAEIYWRQNQIDQAERVFRRLLEQPSVDVLLSAAKFFAGTGRSAEADGLVRQIQNMDLPPGVREMALGEFYSRHGTAQQAIEQYRRVVAAHPANATARRALIIQHLRAGSVEDALAACDEGLKSLPADPALRAFSRSAPDVRAMFGEPACVPLIVAILQSPADSSIAVEALNVLADAHRGTIPSGELVTRLRPLADRAPSLVPLQLILVQRYIAADRLDDAVALAQRTLQAAPASIEVAQLTAQVMMLARNWQQALAAANRWRELAGPQPLAPDIFIAALYLRQGDPQAAARQIQPYLAQALKEPDKYPDVITTHAQILVRTDRIQDAASLLWPLAEKSASWRKTWCGFVGGLIISGNFPAAQAWLDRLAAVVPESASEERLLLSQLWHDLGRRSNQPAYVEKARAVVRQLASAAQPSADMLFALGVFDDQDGNLAEAEKSYRRALQLQPEYPEVQNNLAMVLLRNNGDLKEAINLASQAVKQRPQVAAFHDTLGQVLGRAQNYSQAIASLMKATQLDPGNLGYWLNLAEVCEQASQTEDRDRALRQVERLLPRYEGQQLSQSVLARIERLRSRAASRPATATAPLP